MKAVHYPQNEQQIAHEDRFHRQEALHTCSRESPAHREPPWRGYKNGRSARGLSCEPWRKQRQERNRVTQMDDPPTETEGGRILRGNYWGNVWKLCGSFTSLKVHYRCLFPPFIVGSSLYGNMKCFFNSQSARSILLERSDINNFVFVFPTK